MSDQLHLCSWNNKMLFWCNCFCSRFGTLGLGMMQKLAMTASILNFFSSAPSCSMQYGGEKQKYFWIIWSSLWWHPFFFILGYNWESQFCKLLLIWMRFTTYVKNCINVAKLLRYLEMIPIRYRYWYRYLYRYDTMRFLQKVYVEASPNCNTALFNFGAATFNRQYDIKVTHFVLVFYYTCPFTWTLFVRS